MSLSPFPAPSFDYADMPSPLGESENTITVLLRPAQGRGAPIRWESLVGEVGGQGHREEAPPLTQSPPPWASSASSSFSFSLRAQSVWRREFCDPGQVESLQPLPSEAMGV